MGFFDWFRRQSSTVATSASSATPPRATDRNAWQPALLAFVRERHAASPPRVEADFGPLEREQFRAEGGFLGSWLREYGPRMLGQRRMLLEGMGRASALPIVVVHGDLPAVAAMRHVAGEHVSTGERRIVTLLDEDYQAFIGQHPEEREFDFHVSSWSRFVPASPALLDRAREKGIGTGAGLTYLNHITGTLWGSQNGMEVENLWAWDGERLELVAEALTHKRY